jgi:APA family basic amino acid/polyamine antiporter
VDGLSEERRKLTAFDATLLVMGGIIGVGLFFNPHRIAQLVPEAPAYLGLWAFGGLVALCAGFTFAELGGSLPREGGWFVYLCEAFGPLPAFLFAWVVLLVISTGAIASIAKFFAISLHRALPELVTDRLEVQFALAAALVVGTTLVALSGVRRAALVQDACMLIKLGVVAALVLGGVAWAGRAGDAAAPPPAVDASPAAAGVDGILLALLPIFFTYGGWQLLGYVATEVRDPQRTLPRAILIGSVGVVLVYLVANASFLYVLGIDGVAQDEGFATTLATHAFGARGARLLAGGMAVSAFGICAVNIITAPWLYVAMARQRLFFQGIGRLNARTGVPTWALAIQCTIALVYLAFSLDYLVDWVVFVEWIFHGLAALALLRLRFVRPELPRPFASPLYPLAPLVYLATAFLVVGGTLWQAQPRMTLTALAIVALGAIVYVPWRALVGRSSTPTP